MFFTQLYQKVETSFCVIQSTASQTTIWTQPLFLLVEIKMMQQQALHHSKRVCTYIFEVIFSSPFINSNMKELWQLWLSPLPWSFFFLKPKLWRNVWLFLSTNKKVRMWKMDKRTNTLFIIFNAKSYSMTCMHLRNHTLLPVNKTVSSVSQNTVSWSEADSAAWPLALILIMSILHSVMFNDDKRLFHFLEETGWIGQNLSTVHWELGKWQQKSEAFIQHAKLNKKVS